MENKLMIFENDAFGKVRTLNLNGEPWFVAADVCKALELGNPSMTVERLDDDEKGISTIDTLGGKQRIMSATVTAARTPSSPPWARACSRNCSAAARRFQLID